jgi:ABC-type multidrug transport system ATPase subunit
LSVDYLGPVEAADAGGLAVDVRGLVKSYSGAQVVRGIDLAIPRGEVFALLGPNGAGKTTTVEILEGYQARDSGEVSVLGMDPSRQRARLKSRYRDRVAVHGHRPVPHRPRDDRHVRDLLPAPAVS